MNAHRNSVLVGACAAALLGGCAQMGPKQEARAGDVAPVYRVQQPAGTAAGQYAVGRIDLAEGRIDAAIVRFRNALKLDPAFVEAHNGLGVAFGMQGRFEEAAEAFRSVLERGPASAHVLNNLGYAQMKAGRLHDAWRSFGQSLDLDPKNASTRENVRLLADLRRGGGAAPVAAEDTQKALAETPRDVAQERPVVEPRRAEAVHSVSDDSVLVRLSANVYELRRADRQEQAVSAQAIPLRDVAIATTPAARTEAAAPPVVQHELAPTVPSAVEARLTKPAERSAPAASQTSPAVASTVSRPISSSPVAAKPLRSASRAAQHAPLWVSRFEVSNGAGIERLATRTATQFARLGIGITRVSNYESFDRARTEIHYRKGFFEQARLVQKNLPVPAKLVASSDLRRDINVRLVVGRDMGRAVIAGWGSDGPAQASTDDVKSLESAATDRAQSAPTHRLAGVVAGNFGGGWRCL